MAFGGSKARRVVGRLVYVIIWRPINFAGIRDNPRYIQNRTEWYLYAESCTKQTERSECTGLTLKCCTCQNYEAGGGLYALCITNVHELGRTRNRWLAPTQCIAAKSQFLLFLLYCASCYYSGHVSFQKGTGPYV